MCFTGSNCLKLETDDNFKKEKLATYVWKITILSKLGEKLGFQLLKVVRDGEGIISSRGDKEIKDEVDAIHC